MDVVDGEVSDPRGPPSVNIPASTIRRAGREGLPGLNDPDRVTGMIVRGCRSSRSIFSPTSRSSSLHDVSRRPLMRAARTTGADTF
jgi:hypothetical protein